MKSPLVVTREIRDGGAIVFHLSGSLHGSPECYAFQEETQKFFTAGGGKAVLELGGLEQMDSTGVGIIASIVSSARTADGAVALAGMTRRVEQLLSVVWLLKVVEHAPTVDEALARLSTPPAS